MRITVIFHRFGPYHLARLEAAARVCDLTGIELGEETSEYGWDKVLGARGFTRVTLFPDGDSRSAAPREVQIRVQQALRDAHPDVVAIPGWSDRAAFVALAWCVENHVPAIVMSESTAHDEPRVWWKEFVKRRLVSLYSTALVGGRRHADYLHQLGMPRDCITTGYDVVDNAHFRSRGRVLELAADLHSPSNDYFLACARFIAKKNLPMLLRAYAQYRAAVVDSKGQGIEVSSPTIPWSLVILGDGPQREALKSQITDLKLQDVALLPGFQQYH
jgi:1,2-diacylglycerol 3-alpha-glucosyltransferase